MEPQRFDDLGQPIAAAHLEGNTLDGGWTVRRLLSWENNAKSGNAFSYGYEVEHTNGGKAYLKALDIHRAMTADDMPGEMKKMLDQFVFERQLLEHLCDGKKLSRIVQVKGYGHIFLDEEMFRFNRVDYIILELADGDLRDVLDDGGKALDDSWRFECLKDIAAAIAQLHGVDIAHGDVKPSNILEFAKQRYPKLGDFGSATGAGRENPAIVDLTFLGDPHYSPPELLYGYRSPEWSQGARAGDLYLLGSMVLTLFADSGTITALIINEMAIGHRPTWHHGHWHGSYKDVLPYLEHAFNTVICDFETRMKSRLGVKTTVKLVGILRELCHPDPYRRGHPADIAGPGNSLALHRYVATFDYLSALARIRPQAA